MASKKRRPKRRRETPPAPKRRTTRRTATPEPPPGEDLGTRARRVAGTVLDAFERDPEAAIEKLERIGKAGVAVAEQFHKNPPEAKRVARNAALSGFAKYLKTVLR